MNGTARTTHDRGAGVGAAGGAINESGRGAPGVGSVIASKRESHPSIRQATVYRLLVGAAPLAGGPVEIDVRHASSNDAAMRSIPRGAGLVLGGLLLLTAVVSVARGVGLRVSGDAGIELIGPRYDFHHFLGDATLVWETGGLEPRSARGEERQLPFYLPVVPLAIAPIAALGPAGAAFVWATLHVIALIISFACLHGFAKSRGLSPRVSWELVAWAGLLSLMTIYEAARFNQTSFVILALVLLGARSLRYGRDLSAGLWVASAAIYKLVPLLLIFWLIAARRWRALFAMLVGALLIAIVPCLIAFGPSQTVVYHQQWWDYSVRGIAKQGFQADVRDHFRDHRNQAIREVVGRWTDPQHPYRMSAQPLTLSTDTARLLDRAISALVGLLLVVVSALALRPRAPTNITRHARSTQFALQATVAAFLIAMMALAPLMRQYYLVWTLPALVILLVEARASGVLGRTIAWGMISAWITAQVAWGFPSARAAGIHLLVLLMMMAALLLLALMAPTTAARLSEPGRKPPDTTST